MRNRSGHNVCLKLLELDEKKVHLEKKSSRNENKFGEVNHNVLSQICSWTSYVITEHKHSKRADSTLVSSSVANINPKID